MLRPLLLKIPQPLRFVIAGGTVSLTSMVTTLVLDALGVHIQVAIPIGYCTGLALHFTLQRYFVFAGHDEFTLQLHHQLGRYAIVAVVQYAAIAGLTAVLPGVLGLDERTVYVGVFITATAVTFLVNRTFVFHGESSGGASAVDEAGA